MEITHDGRYLFAVNTAVPSISRYRICGGWVAASARQHGVQSAHRAERRSTPGSHQTASTLWVVDSGAAKVSGFTGHGGNLTELGSSPTPLPAGATPFGIVVT